MGRLLSVILLLIFILCCMWAGFSLSAHKDKVLRDSKVIQGTEVEECLFLRNLDGVKYWLQGWCESGHGE